MRAGVRTADSSDLRSYTQVSEVLSVLLALDLPLTTARVEGRPAQAIQRIERSRLLGLPLSLPPGPIGLFSASARRSACSGSWG